MAGQGAVIRRVAATLTEFEWVVIFVCVPNTPHIGVVPIPTLSGVSRQRYPDVAAANGQIMLLAEVEIALTPAVATDIKLRFSEMLRSLSDPRVWATWSRSLRDRGHLSVPVTFAAPRLSLVLCQPIKVTAAPLVEDLIRSGISCVYIDDFAPHQP